MRTTKTDMELCLEVRDGSNTDEALTELYLRYRGLVHNTTCGFFAVGWSYDDLLQEARIGLWKAALTWNGTHAFGPWLQFVARRQVMTLVTVSRRKKAQPLWGHNNLESVGDVAIPVGQEWQTYEPGPIDLQEIIEATDLTDLERDVIGWYLEGFTYEEIATKVGIDRKKVDNAKQRAVMKLRVTGKVFQ